MKRGDLDTPMQGGSDPGTGGSQAGDKEGTSLMPGTFGGGLSTPMRTMWPGPGTTPAKDLPGLQVTEEVGGFGNANGPVLGPPLEAKPLDKK
jgi:hypothetical protein